MRPSLLIDMNMSPDWVPFLQRGGYSAVHWSSIGDARAADATIMAHAAVSGQVILTRDVDFGTALAVTHAPGPSVIQIRARNVLPDGIGSQLLLVLQQYQVDLAAGALIVFEEAKNRVRVLPL